jgi:hypothetical protein
VHRFWSFRRAAAVGLIAACGLTLTGCAGAGLMLAGTGAGVAAGTGVNHTLNGIAYKTFTAPLPELELATTDALKTMGIQVEKAEDIERGRKITAIAEARTIEIELERLSPEATRMRVTAIQDVPILRDSATATEIILQTANTIDDRRERAVAQKQAAEVKSATGKNAKK